MKNKEIKAICFDLDGVYFTSAGFKSFKQKIIDMGITKEKVDYVLHGEPMDRFKRGEVQEKVFWQEAMEYWGLDISPEQLIALLPLGYEIDTQVKSLVNKLRLNGYLTCICSNNFSTRINKLEERFHFLQDFDVHIFSYQIGIVKPDKRIFQALVEKTNCNPGEIVYSDDNESKLTGAKDLGLPCFLFVNFGSFVEKIEELGVVL